MVTEWLSQSRSLRGEIERVDDALRTAADSAKLNPRALIAAESVPVTDLTVALRVTAHAFSATAAAKIERAGGTVTELS